MQEPPAPKPAFTVRISSRRDAGAGMHLVVLEAPPAATAAYAHAGQYVWLGAWFVLASAPGHAIWEVIVRPSGDAAILLSTAPIGTTIEAAGPFGDGFPMAHGAPLVIAATGGAIAAARAVMAERIEKGDASSTQLFLGAATHAELPLADELDRWRAAGAVVIPCISSEGSRVQDVARATLSVPRGTVLLLAGHAGMIEAMQALATEKGLTAYVNY